MGIPQLQDHTPGTTVVFLRAAGPGESAALPEMSAECATGLFPSLWASASERTVHSGGARQRDEITHQHFMLLGVAYYTWGASAVLLLLLLLHALAASRGRRRRGHA